MTSSLARIRPSLRRAAFVAALGAFMVPATAGAAVHAEASAKKKKAKPPVVTRVTPMKVEIGQKLEIRGRYFLRGRNKNTVVFKRSGGKAVFVKADVGTTKLLRLTVPTKLQKEFTTRGTALQPTRFRIRVLAKKFGKRYTKSSRSPLVFLHSTPPPPGFVESQPDGDCDGDGAKNKIDSDDDNDGLTDDVEQSLNLNPCNGDTDSDGVEDRWEFDCDHNGILNRAEGDDDKDLLLDDLEGRIGTNACSKDSDADGVEDGYEYRSAVDLNNDEYQNPNASMPDVLKRPYPNPLFSDDAGIDFDGDSLTQAEEQALWKYTAARLGTALDLNQLYYSDGLKYSIYRNVAGDRRAPNLAAAGYERQTNFESWLTSSHYETVYLPQAGTTYSILDSNHDGSGVTAAGQLYSERDHLDTDNDTWLSDDERDEDADGLSNYEEQHGRMMVTWFDQTYTRENPFPIKYAGTNAADEDSDGDGVRDGADDQDHDDVPNMMELSRKQAAPGRAFDDPKLDKNAGISTPAFARVNPYNPCLPDTTSRTCPIYTPFGPSALGAVRRAGDRRRRSQLPGAQLAPQINPPRGRGPLTSGPRSLRGVAAAADRRAWSRPSAMVSPPGRCSRSPARR